MSRLLLALSIGAGATGPAPALPHADPCQASRLGPPDVRLQVRLPDQTVFQEGEIIPLRLALSSSATDKYYAETRTYDRSGRLAAEAFCLDPPTARDPLADYFGSQLFGFIGGGLSPGPRVLGEEPFLIERELNEWRSLPPGQYELEVQAWVSRVAAPDEPGPGMVPVAVWSNKVALDVVPAAPEWQQAQLSRALSMLDSGEDGQARQGARVLRFLGSESATRELVRRYHGDPEQPHGWEFRFGIIGSPHRTTAIAAMRSALVDAQHPVTQEFVRVLALLATETDPKNRLAAYDGANPSEPWRRQYEAKRTAYEALVREHLEAVAGALTHKSPEARNRSIDLLLQSLGTDSGTRSQKQQLLLAAWDSLPPLQQNRIIGPGWEEVGGPELLPILRRILDRPVRNRPMADGVERELALRRLNALSPAEGRERILRETQDTRGDISIAALGVLPEKELPQIEQPVLAKLRGGTGLDIDFQLMDRYGSARALPAMKAIYEERRGRWACAPQSAMLRYFLRVAPEYGLTEVTAALDEREHTGCYGSVFGGQAPGLGLAEALSVPAVERLAIRALDDPSADVARDAAQALGKYGSAAAESALWKRLEQFHEDWKDKAEQLRYREGRDARVVAQAALQQALVQSIATGQVWLCGPDELKALQALVTSSESAQVESWIREWTDWGDAVSLFLSWGGPEATLHYRVGHVWEEGLPRLKRRLAQLPAGTRLMAQAADRDERAAAIGAVERAARDAGLELEWRARARRRR